jgi:gliding motility-associated-like protein
LLDAGIYYTYLWNDSTTGRFLMAYKPGTYFVDVTGQCGEGTDTLNLHLLDCDFFVPNVFTPNGDGINDYFEVVSKNLYSYRLSVYNRWGEKIFGSEQIETQWDGTYKGEACAEGPYFWVAEYSRKSNFGEIKQLKVQGSITLLR